MDKRQREELDRYITGNYGEDHPFNKSPEPIQAVFHELPREVRLRFDKLWSMRALKTWPVDRLETLYEYLYIYWPGIYDFIGKHEDLGKTLDTITGFNSQSMAKGHACARWIEQLRRMWRKNGDIPF